MEYGVVVHGAVSLPDKAAHPGAALRRELAVEDNDDSFLWAGRDDGGLQEEILHLFLLVQVQGSLRGQRGSLVQSTGTDPEAIYRRKY